MAIKEDIVKMEATIAQMQATGADLFAEEIKNLQIKIENAKAEEAANTAQTTSETPLETAVIREEQTDLEKMKIAVKELEAAGKDLFSDEIKIIQTKIDAAEATTTTETKKIETVGEDFVQKYGVTTARAIEIILLLVILYKLF